MACETKHMRGKLELQQKLQWQGRMSRRKGMGK